MSILTLILTFCCYCDAGAYFFGSTGFNVTDKLAKVFELGKKDFEDIKKKSELGACWTESITYMTDGCRNLTADVQMNIALRYSDCFVSSCGLQSHGCGLLSGVTRSQCIKGMSRKGYHAFARFFISLQNICFFLESERWYNRTQTNVNNLVSSSALLAQHMKDSSKFKSSLLNSQKQTLHLQNKFRQNLSTFKHIFTKYEVAWNSTVEKYVSVALKQQKLVLTIYDVFSVLNGWAVNRYCWLGTVTFYIVSVACMYAVTVQKKVRCARLRIVLVLTANVFIEKLMYSYIFQRKLLQEANDLNSWLWTTRKVSIFLCVVVTFCSAYSYSDYNFLSTQWNIRINTRLNALRICLQKGNTRVLPVAEDLKFSYTQKNQWLGNTLCRTGNLKHTRSTKASDLKTPPTVLQDTTVTSLRRYNLRTRSTPPVDTTVAA